MINCERCYKPATCIGIDGSGERYQCRFCANEWIRKTVHEILADGRAKAAAEALAAVQVSGVDVDLDGMNEDFIAGQRAALSDVADYLAEQLDLSGPSTDLNMALDVVKAYIKRLK
jgi:hypothetical protein